MPNQIKMKMIDNSTEEQFSFTFLCGVCEKQWVSVPIKPYAGVREIAIRQADHCAAYERAHTEAQRYHNFCRNCQKWVCDDCFVVTPEEDICRNCVAK
jgi:hypothetical protein